MNISDISSLSSLKTQDVPQKAQVSLQKGASKQAEAVAQQIFSGIAQNPAPESGKGQNVNKVA